MALTILKVGGFDMLPRLRDELEKRGEYFVDSILAPEERKAVRSSIHPSIHQVMRCSCMAAKLQLQHGKDKD